jgi:hypothetical protein
MRLSHPKSLSCDYIDDGYPRSAEPVKVVDYESDSGRDGTANGYDPLPPHRSLHDPLEHVSIVGSDPD